MAAIDKFYENLVDARTDWFEETVLSSIIYDPSFYSRIANVLCINPENQKYIGEFHKDLDNEIYRAVDEYYRHLGGANPKPIHVRFAIALLEGMANKGEIIDVDEVEMAMERLAEVRKAYVGPSSISIASGGFAHWLTKVRTVRIMQEGTATDNWSSAELLTRVQTVSGVIKRTEDKQTVFKFGEGLAQVQVDVQRYSTGLHRFDQAMGGGLARKESTLFVAPPSAGKTILGLQLGFTLAMDSKLKVLYITTEQPHDELELRILSNFCSIRFELIKDGFSKERMTTKSQVECYTRLMDELPDRMSIKDWKEDRSKSVLTDLDSEIKRFQDDNGGLDVIILDWIGGALGQNLLNDPGAIRHVYQLTADRVSDIAGDTDLVGKRGVVSIAFAQAHPSLSVNKKMVDASCISECKSMHRNYTNGAGITALLDQAFIDAGDSGGNPIYSKIQNFYGFKGRKAVGGCSPFRREYQYQRIVDKP